MKRRCIYLLYMFKREWRKQAKCGCQSVELRLGEGERMDRIEGIFMN